MSSAEWAEFYAQIEKHEAGEPVDDGWSVSKFFSGWGVTRLRDGAHVYVSRKVVS